MPTRKSAIYRTDLLAHRMNAGKEARVRALLLAWRRAAAAQAREQWCLVFQTGAPSKRHDVSRTGCKVLGTSYGQMVRRQVVGQIESYLSNRANDFRELVDGSSVGPVTRHQLHFINKCQAWYSRQALVMKDGSVIPPEVRKLARLLMRRLLAKHRKPNLRRVSMMIDQRCIKLAPATKAKAFPLWARLSTLDKERRIDIPVNTYPHFEERQGKRAMSVQVTERDGEISFGVMTDMAEAFAASRAAYCPKIEVLALDLGFKTLFGTSDGDLLGQSWMDRLLEIDRKITNLAAYRQKHGLKTLSRRYRACVEQLRGFIRSEVGRILNRLVATHAPAEIVIERIVFRSQALSNRLNRLLTIIGKKEIRRKLLDLEGRFGIVVTEVQAAYSSQECSACHYVDKRNRPVQHAFCCRWCGSKRHADVNAARNLLRRRSDATIGDPRRPKQAILAELVRRFTERFTRPKGGATDPRLKNPYFKGWMPLVT